MHRARVRLLLLVGCLWSRICEGSFICCCSLVAYRPSNMLVYLRDGSAKTVVLGRLGGGGCSLGCLSSQQHASVSQGRIFEDSFICCCSLVAYRPSNTLVYLRDGSSKTVLFVVVRWLLIVPATCWCISWTHLRRWFCCCSLGCLSSQQHASVSQGRIFEDSFICCCSLVAYRPSNMLVYPSDGSGQTILHAATLR